MTDPQEPITRGSHPVLMLNADHTPLDLIGWRDAVGVVMRDRAYVVRDYDRVIHSPSIEMPIPAVVALRRYVRAGRHAAFTRRNVFLAYAKRDRNGVFWVCALCGDPERDSEEMTFEHVMPRCRNGVSNWNNVVLAHSHCNNHKGGRTLAEAGMRLYVKIAHPSEHDILIRRIASDVGTPHETWNDYLSDAYWDVEIEP